MSYWHILGISPTDNEDEIKRAYRAQLKHHHPEDDPEGFQQLKQAYDQALASLHQPVTTALFDAPEPSPVNVELGNSFDAVLHDPAQRFNKASWQAWQQTYAMANLTQQRAVASHAADAMLAHRWFPGDVVGWLWDIFQWQSLLDGSDGDQDLGSFLLHWSRAKCSVPLDSLAELSPAHQRAVLLTLQPLSRAHEACQPNAIAHILHTPLPGVHLHHPAYWLSILHAFSAISYWPEATSLHAIEHLITLPHSALQADDWQLIARACYMQRLPTQYLMCVEKALEGQHYAVAAECLYKWTADQDLAMTAAFLYQQWDPQPAMWWLFQTQWHEDASRNPLRFRFLRDAIDGERCNTVLSPLQHDQINDIHDLFYAGVWAGCFGHTHDMALWQQKAAEFSVDDKPDALLLQLLANWLTQQQAAQPYAGSLEEKLHQYANPTWFDIDPLTEEEIASLSHDQWLDLYQKFPLLPDAWFNALKEKEIFTTEIFDRKRVTGYPSSLGFHRVVNPDYELISPLGGQRFDGDFAWLPVYYQLLVSQSSDIAVPVPAKPPASLKTCPLLAAMPSILQPETLQLEQFNALLPYPEQFVIRSLVHDQVIYLQRAHDVDHLLQHAKSDPYYLAALSLKLKNEGNFDSAVVAWNLLASDESVPKTFKTTIRWVKDELIEYRSRSDTNYDSADYGTQKYLHLLLSQDLDWLPTGQQLISYQTPKEGENYYHPMAYLISLLHHGPDAIGVDMYKLKRLTDKKNPLSDREKAMADLAILALDNKFQRQIERDVDAHGNKAISHSRRPLQIIAIFLAIFWWRAGDPVDLMGLLSTTHWQDLLPIGIFVVGQVCLCRSLLRAMQPSNRGFYILPLAIEVYLGWSNGAISGMPLAFYNAFVSLGINEIGFGGKWEKQVVAKKQSPIKRLLYDHNREPVI
uniref:J domain-containing protein n=1 Tax=Thaumasiovibrio occultus TaxID=1891184 RepID=UPI000B35D910|nr:J domain-containing protein [Thaumasiovibrio occultus]